MKTRQSKIYILLRLYEQLGVYWNCSFLHSLPTLIVQLMINRWNALIYVFVAHLPRQIWVFVGSSMLLSKSSIDDMRDQMPINVIRCEDKSSYKLTYHGICKCMSKKNTKRNYNIHGCSYRSNLIMERERFICFLRNAIKCMTFWMKIPVRKWSWINNCLR